MFVLYSWPAACTDNLAAISKHLLRLGNALATYATAQDRTRQYATTLRCPKTRTGRYSAIQDDCGRTEFEHRDRHSNALRATGRAPSPRARRRDFPDGGQPQVVVEASAGIVYDDDEVDVRVAHRSYRASRVEKGGYCPNRAVSWAAGWGAFIHSA